MGVRGCGGQLEPFVIKPDSSSSCTALPCSALVSAALGCLPRVSGHPASWNWLTRKLSCLLLDFPHLPPPSPSTHPAWTLPPRSALLVMPITHSNNCKDPQSNPLRCLDLESQKKSSRATENTSFTVWTAHVVWCKCLMFDRVIYYFFMFILIMSLD